MTTPSATILFVVLASSLLGPAQEARAPAGAQAPSRPGSLREIVPGHYAYTTTNAGRVFSGGVIVTAEGVLVVDALDSEATARAERASIAGTIARPVRYLVSSSFHDPYSKGNLAYADVFKIGHDNYRAGLLDQMERGGAPADERRARLPNETFRDRLTVYLGGKEIQVLHFGRAHTRGDAIVFVPQDRIAYLSELFFTDEFPNMAQGYGVSWIRVLDAVETLDADVFVPGHGPIPDDPRATRAELHGMRQLLVDARDAVQDQITRGATEDQAVAAVKLQRYEKLPNYTPQKDVTVRRMYKELTGQLP